MQHLRQQLLPSVFHGICLERKIWSTDGVKVSDTAGLEAELAYPLVRQAKAVRVQDASSESSRNRFNLQLVVAQDWFTISALSAEFISGMKP